MGLWKMPAKGKGPLAVVQLYSTDFKWMWFKDPILLHYFQKTFKIAYQQVQEGSISSNAKVTFKIFPVGIFQVQVQSMFSG